MDRWGGLLTPGDQPSDCLCSSGVAMSIGTTIHTQLRSTVYEMLASLLSVGHGEWDQGPGWCLLWGGPSSSLSPGFLSLPQQAPPLALPRVPLDTLAHILPQCALRPYPF